MVIKQTVSVPHFRQFKSVHTLKICPWDAWQYYSPLHVTLLVHLPYSPWYMHYKNHLILLEFGKQYMLWNSLNSLVTTAHSLHVVCTPQLTGSIIEDLLPHCTIPLFKTAHRPRRILSTKKKMQTNKLARHFTVSAVSSLALSPCYPQERVMFSYCNILVLLDRTTMKQTASVRKKYIDRIIDYSTKNKTKHLLHSCERVCISVKYSHAAYSSNTKPAHCRYFINICRLLPSCLDFILPTGKDRRKVHDSVLFYFMYTVSTNASLLIEIWIFNTLYCKRCDIRHTRDKCLPYITIFWISERYTYSLSECT